MTSAAQEHPGRNGPDPLALTLVEIPAGRFLMGSLNEEEEGSCNYERPQHPVRLERFFMGQTPITQGQWREVAQWKPRQGEQWGRELNHDPAFFQVKEGRARLLEGEVSTAQRPVEQVSWLAAMEFCHRLSQRTGRHFTLPSEAQWEYACRAGTRTPFAFGETLSDELANYNTCETYGNPKGVYRGQTTPVGMFPSNAWGLHDMHGNVWEWCLDHWHESYKGAPEDGSAWLKDDANDSADRLLRGGSWYDFPWDCRSADRFHERPDYAYDSFGFRVVASSTPSLSL